MKRSVLLAGCVAVLVLGLASVAQAQGHRCAVKGLLGTWTFTESGMFVTPTNLNYTVAAVGRYKFAADGTFTGSQWVSTQGQPIGFDTKDGTYEVNEDCSITMFINGYRDGVKTRESIWEIVLAADTSDAGGLPKVLDIVQASGVTEFRGISRSLKALVPNTGWVPMMPVMTLTATKVASR